MVQSRHLVDLITVAQLPDTCTCDEQTVLGLDPLKVMVADEVDVRWVCDEG